MYGSINLPTISTGTSLMKMSGGLGGGGVTQMSPMESMKEVFLEIRDNTKETVELLKTMVLGDATQDKKDAIAAGDTDTDKKPKEKGPGILSRVMGGLKGAFSSLMPEKGGFMDTLLKLGLAVGGVALLKYFGDDMVPVLADLLKSIKEGKIGENIKAAYEYIKEVGVDAFEKLKVNTILFIDGVKKVMGIIQGAYKAVETYVMSFDTKGAEHPAGKQFGTIDEGDGKLDSEEFDAMKEDLRDKAFDIIGNFFSDLMLALGGALLASTFITKAAPLLLAHPAIKSIFSFGKVPVAGSLATTVPAAAGMSAGFAALGIGALLLYGVTTTYKNINDSMAKTLKENNDEFVASSFFANFFGGDDEGGAMNALKQAFLVGGTGALAGLGIAGTMAAAGAAFGPPGIIMGGLIGLGIGGIIGVMSGLTGSEKLDKMFKKFGKKVNDTIDAMNGFFDGLLDSFKSLVTGSTTKYETDEDALTKDLLKLIQDKKDAELDILEREAGGFMIPSRVRNKPAEIQKAIDKQINLIANVDEATTKYDEEQMVSGTKKINNQLKNLRARRDENVEGLKRAIENDNVKGQKAFRKAIEFRNQQILAVEAEKQNLLKTEYNVDYKIPKIKMDPVINKFDDSMQRSPNHPSNATIIANNNNDSSTKVASETNILGNLSQDNRHFTALALGYKQMKMQTG